MGFRHWLTMMAMVTGAALLLAACTSPGTTFTYRDLKVSLGPTSAPAQPATTQTSTISFTLRNTWNQPVTGVKWILRDITDVLMPVVVDEDDTVAIAAFDRVVIDVALPTQSAGKRTYEVEVDPDDDAPEEDETNNISETLTVITANQDIAFGTGAAITTVSPNSAQQLTLTFTINDIVNAAATPGGTVSVPYSITVQNTPDDTPVAVAPDAATVPSPAQVDPTGTNPLPVSVTLPPTGSAGTFIYTITLSPGNGDDSNPNNNTSTVTVEIIPST